MVLPFPASAVQTLLADLQDEANVLSEELARGPLDEMTLTRSLNFVRRSEELLSSTARVAAGKEALTKDQIRALCELNIEVVVARSRILAHAGAVRKAA